MAAFFLSSRTTLPLSITSRNPRHCPYDAASLPRPVFPLWPSSRRAERSPPGSPYLHTPLLGSLAPRNAFCYSNLPVGLSVRVPPPPPCLALGCFLLASLLHQSWAVLHHLSTPPKKNSSNSHGCCIPLLTLSSSLPSQLQSTIKSVKDQADPNSRRY